MLTDEQLTQEVRRALERESAGITPPADLLARIHEELRGSPAAERHWWRARPHRLRLRAGHLAPAAALLVVVAVVAVFLGVHGREPSGSAATQHSLTLVYRAEPTAQTPNVTRDAILRAIQTMNQRAHELGVSGARISIQGQDQISATLSGVKNTKLAEQLLGTTARLEFYDWEADAIAPSSQPVARLLTTRDPSAVAISQGGGSAAPGSAGAGSLSLYAAVKLAAKQPRQASPENARFGAEYFAFGAPGSTACALAARFYRAFLLDPHSYCYLAGPQDTLTDLAAALPSGVRSSPKDVQTLAVQQGWAVLQAVPPGGFGHELPWSDPTAQYFVLRDRVALFGNQITKPRQSRDASGEPDIQFGFTGKGASAFSTVTAQIAHRGDLVSGLGHNLDQHFALALDTQLISVPSIDYRTYPDGINGVNGGDITGGFTIGAARALAAQLRLGALPVRLKLIGVARSR